MKQLENNKEYDFHIFDCDGVLLDSNPSKAAAFYHATREYGHDKALQMVKYHKKAGGISRRARFDYFFTNILGREPEPDELEKCMSMCNERAEQGADFAPLTRGVREYLARIPYRHRICISGIETPELQRILERKNLSFFLLYGGPTHKEEHLKSINVPGNCIYYGDTYDDFVSATNAGMDFCMIGKYNDWLDHEEFFKNGKFSNVRVFQTFESILKKTPGHLRR